MQWGILLFYGLAGALIWSALVRPLRPGLIWVPVAGGLGGVSAYFALREAAPLRLVPDTLSFLDLTSLMAAGALGGVSLCALFGIVRWVSLR